MKRNLDLFRDVTKMVVFIFQLYVIIGLLTAATWGTQHEISSLPYTASTNGENYSDTFTIAGDKVSGTGNGIDITGDNLVFEFGNDTLAFGSTPNTTGYYGIRFNDADHIIINGGVILMAATDSTSENRKQVTFYINSRALYFNGTKFITPHGQNQNNVTGRTYIDSVEFNQCLFRNKVTAFSERDTYDGISVKMADGAGYGSQGEQDGYFHIKFYGCKWDTAWGGAIAFSPMKVIVDHCTTYVDNRNDYYTYPSGDMYHGTTNCGHIVNFWGYLPGSKLSNNVFISGDYYTGSDIGILFENTEGTAENPVVVCSNYVDVHAGVDANYGPMNAKAFKSRYTNYYVDIFDNTFISRTASTGSAFSDFTTAMDIAYFGEYDGIPDTSVCFWGNDIYAIAEDSTTAALGNTSATRWHGRTSDNIWYKQTNNRFAKNNIYTSCVAYKFVCYDHGPAYWRADSNTVTFINDYGGETQWLIHANVCTDSPNDTIADGIYADDYDTLIYITTTDGAEASVCLVRTWDILVLDGNGYATPNAIVKITNHYGQLAGTDTSGSNGWVHIPCRYWLEADPGTDSMAFNPFSYFAYIENDSAKVASDTLKHDDYTDTLTLAGFYGAGPRPDTLQGEWFHASTGQYLIVDLGNWPYDNPLKWRIDSLVALRDWPIQSRLWDYRYNGNCNTGLHNGSRSWNYAAAYEEDAGYMIGDPYHDYNTEAGCLSTQNWYDMSFLSNIFKSAYTDRSDTSQVWTKLMEPHYRIDSDLDPDTQYVDLDYLIIKLSVFWTTMVGDSLDEWKAEVEEGLDSMALYPNKVFAIWAGTPYAYTNLDSADKVNGINFIYWLQDTVTTPDNVVTWGGVFLGLVELDTAETEYGGYADGMSTDGTHPSAAGSVIGQDSIVVWFDRFFDFLETYYDTTQEEPAPDTSLAQTITCTDTGYVDLTIADDITETNCTLDSLKLLISDDNFVNTDTTDMVATTDTNYQFTSLSDNTEYKIKVVGYADEETNTSNTLTITTLTIPDTTIAQVLTESAKDSVKIDVSNDYTLVNTVIDTSIFYISTDTFTTVLDSTIFVSPADPKTHSFEGLDYITNYQMMVVSWDESAGVTDTSNILHSVTDAGPSEEPPPTASKRMRFRK